MVAISKTHQDFNWTKPCVQTLTSDLINMFFLTGQWNSALWWWITIYWHDEMPPKLQCIHMISKLCMVAAADSKRTKKGKAFPLQATAGPEGSRKLRLLDFLTTAQYGGSLSALRTGRLYPQGYSWYSFSLGAESTPGPRFGRKEMCHWKIQWHHRESIPGPSD